jgi:hypothetical protein
LLAEFVREAFMTGFGFGKLEQKLSYGNVTRAVSCLAVKALCLIFHFLGELARFAKDERACQPGRRLVRDEVLDVVAADEGQVFAELSSIEIVQHRAMVHLFLGHLVEDLGRRRVLLAKALREIAIDAAVFFFIGNRKGQNFLFGQIGKTFHGRSLQVGRNGFIY